MWTYTDGAVTVRGYCWPGGTARAGSWVLVDQETGSVQSMVPAGEFSHRFRPVDVFADVQRLPTYLGTVTAPDGTALVDLVLDRNPFMLANGPRRAARPHALMVPRSHRDGWSSATASELAARQTAMTLIAAWYRSLDGGHVVFCANDSPPNLDYLRDAEAASGIFPAVAPMRRPPGIPGRMCSTLTCTPSMPNTARPRTTSRQRLRGVPSLRKVTGRSALLSAPKPCRWNGRARGSPPACALWRSRGAAVTAPTSWAWTARCGLCPRWGQPRTRSTGASPGPMA